MIALLTTLNNDASLVIAAARLLINKYLGLLALYFLLGCFLLRFSSVVFRMERSSFKSCLSNEAKQVAVVTHSQYTCSWISSLPPEPQNCLPSHLWGKVKVERIISMSPFEEGWNKKVIHQFAFNEVQETFPWKINLLKV